MARNNENPNKRWAVAKCLIRTSRCNTSHVFHYVDEIDNINNIVRVEKDTILYTLLSRLATFDWGKVDLPRVSFKQNPLFYSKFPLESGQFQSSSRLHYIPPLEAWAPLESHKGELHLIVDRDTSKSEGREVALNNSTFSLPDSDIYSNGWHLDDSNSIAVREKGM